MARLPSSGEEYLRMVRAQARACPDVVIAPKAKAQPYLAVKNTSRMYKVTWQGCAPAPEGCAPSKEWQDQFIKDFELERKNLLSLIGGWPNSRSSSSKKTRTSKRKRNNDLMAEKADAVLMANEVSKRHRSNENGDEESEGEKDDEDERKQNIQELPPIPIIGKNTGKEKDAESIVDLPKFADHSGWRKLCYGHGMERRFSTAATASMTSAASSASSSASTSSTPLMSIIPTELNHSAATSSNTVTTSTPIVTAATTRPLAPTPRLLIRLDQGYVMKLLEYHLKWMLDDDLEDLEGQWLYALLLRADPLVDSDQVAMLRKLAQKCASIRTHLSVESRSKVAAVNMVITAIARVFGQEDLV